MILRNADQRRASADEDQRRAKELTALYAVTAAMSQALGVEEALAHALRQVLSVLDLDCGRIYLWDDQAQQLSLATAQGSPLSLDPDEIALASAECLCGIVIQNGESVLVADPHLIRESSGRHREHVCAAALLLAHERSLGILHVATRRGTPFTERELALLRSIGAQIGIAAENMRLREEVRRAEALSTLMQEMHHRIKNNLQTVADLLSLEMSASRSPEARKSLNDSISRIKSIAAVHQLLSLEQLRVTDITELARQVWDVSLRHLVRPDQHVEAQIGGPPIYLPSKQATALALVMNELISNALEHAFSENGQPNAKPGRLMISLAQDGPQVTVTVTDNGRGLPRDFDLDNNRGLGLQIARTLVEKDLAGTLQLETGAEGGSRATLTFFK